ncbi:MAG: GFA family protein [Acidovorax sp.]|uniref:GFA family protein n=1 Tax=Acidovorax sp. TaxID=1872122 RepID=UPI0039E451C3
MTTPSAQGRCYCGAVSVTVSATLGKLSHCHCGQCRRLSGAAFTTWLTAPRDAMALSGAEHLTAFKPTERLERFFCKVCGAHVFTVDERLPTRYGFPAGLFEGVAMEEPKDHYFVSDKAAWFSLPPGARCFGGVSGMEPMGA